MSKRPDVALTFQQASDFADLQITLDQVKAYLADPLWFDFHGYVTSLRELSVIFNIHYSTLEARCAAGWPLDAALIADPSDGWTRHTIPYLQDDYNTYLKVNKILGDYFKPILVGYDYTIDGGVY